MTKANKKIITRKRSNMVSNSLHSPQSRVNGRIITNCNSNPPIYRTVLFYPDQTRITMRYNAALVWTGAGAVTQCYRGNSVYDPDRTGAGSQPLYYDQMSTVYNKYCVLGARLSAACANASGNLVNVNVFPSKDTTFAGAIYDRNQQQRASYGIVSPNSGANNQLFLGTNDTTSRIYGMVNTEDEGDLTALVGSNPAVAWNFLLAAQSFDGSTVTIYLNVTIDYDVIWSNRIPAYDV